MATAWTTMTRTIHRPALTYALLTFLSCFLELGILIEAIAQDRPLWELGPVLLAFHSANLLTYLLTVPQTVRALALALGMATLTIAPWGMPGTVMAVNSTAGVFLAKLGLQWLRNDLKAQSQPTQGCKALPRLAGFILAFLYSPLAFAVLGVVTLATYLVVSPQMTLYCRPRAAEKRLMVGDQRPVASAPLNTGLSGAEGSTIGGQLRIYLTMAAHSAHYFAFGYGIPLLFAERYGFPVASLGLVYTAGWLGYYLIERLLPPSPRYVAWGHLGSALSIVILALSPSPWTALLAWTATGFGGGTVFMLSHLRISNPYAAGTMALWDNGANLIGLLLFLWAWGRGVPAMGFLAAASLAFISVWAATGLQEIRRAVEMYGG